MKILIVDNECEQLESLRRGIRGHHRIQANSKEEGEGARFLVPLPGILLFADLPCKGGKG